MTKQFIDKYSMVEFSRKSHICISFRETFINVCSVHEKTIHKTMWMKWKRLFAILLTRHLRFASSQEIFLIRNRTYDLKRFHLFALPYIRSLNIWIFKNVFSKYPFKKLCVSVYFCIFFQMFGFKWAEKWRNWN